MRWNTYIARKILESGGYGMLYNWFCTQEQAAVEYGYLYNWYAATDSRNICSAGYHVPAFGDFNTLISYLGGASVAGGKLKEVGLLHWNTPNTGATNEVGFNGVGGGKRTSGLFGLMNTYNTFHTNYSGSVIVAYELSYNGTSFTQITNSSKTLGLSIRPIKDSTTLTHGQTGTYIDPSGIIYPTICIGTQEWVACNIMTKHYRNGDAIPEVTDNTAWAALTTGARCSYNNTESNAGTTKKLSSSDSFIVPTKTIWEDLLNSLDTYDSGLTGWPILGTKLRESGWSHWYQILEGTSGIEGTDDYGLSFVGSGNRDNYDGVFSGLKEWLQLWSSTDIDGYPYAVYTAYSLNEITDSNGEYRAGFSIRLCNTETIHADGYIGSYTQNDGTVIPTIVINGVEWTMNLKETKWSDGTDIQNITDNTAWSLLQAAACCDIDNDPTKR